jgi:hypothetical protein
MTPCRWMQGARERRQVPVRAHANHEVRPQLGKRSAGPRCLSVGPPSCPFLVSAASRLGEFGDLTSFGALRPYDSCPRFPKELKECTPAADTS